MIVIQAKSENELTLGRQGENLARQIIFDVAHWESEYGPGTVELIYQRKQSELPYPVALQRDGSSVAWAVTATDTEFPGGNGKCELRYYVGDVLAKSRTWPTKVILAIPTPTAETPPDPEKGWVDQVLEAGVSAKEASERAEEAAKKAESAVPAGRPTVGKGLKWDSAGQLAVDTADKVEQDNTKPVTSAAVHTEIGNIEALLAAL